jgi:hypothetical protein
VRDAPEPLAFTVIERPVRSRVQQMVDQLVLFPHVALKGPAFGHRVNVRQAERNRLLVPDAKGRDHAEIANRVADPVSLFCAPLPDWK